MDTKQESKYVLSVDPGLATGMVLADITDIDSVQIINAWELDVNGFQDMSEQIISTYGPNVIIVCESFIITTQTAKLSSAPWSLEGIGVLKYLARKNGTRVVLQKPSEKKFAPNEKLHHVGFWFVGGDGHANDAFRHLMIYLVNWHPKWAKNLLM